MNALIPKHGSVTLQAAASACLDRFRQLPTIQFAILSIALNFLVLAEGLASTSLLRKSL
jgi:hypothetical protein